MTDGPFLVSSWQQFLPPNAVLMARRAEATDVTTPQETFRFLFEVPGLDRPDHRDLFDKIIAALNLSPDDYRFAGVAGASAGTVIRFVASEGEEVGILENQTVMTYSLSAMLKNPGLKKTVWAQLKEALTK